MDVLLKNIDNPSDIELFGNYKVELIKYHQQFAQKLGFIAMRMQFVILIKEAIFSF